MSPAKKTSTRKSTAKKTPRAKASDTKSAAAKTSRRKATATTATSKKTASKKTTAKGHSATKTTTTGTPKKTATKRTTAKVPAKSAPKKTATKRTTAQPAAKKTVSPAKSPARSRPPRQAKFDKAQLQSIRDQLTEERGDLERQMQELEESSFDGSQSDVTGEMGMDDDFADAGTATFERERDLSIQNNIRDLIDQITRAMERIDEGLYGTCERCGRPIDAARLKALPHALLCMDCKRREERAR